MMRGDLEKVLFDEQAIHRRLDDMAAQIPNDYRDRELTVIAVLHGSLMFVADLLGRIPLPLKLDCLSVASYHGKAQSSGDVVFGRSPSQMSATEIFWSWMIFWTVVLRLQPFTREVAADYVGFEIEDEFVVGYGLDFREHYRNLPYIGVLRRELLEQPGK